jgi:hypothetical protein
MQTGILVFDRMRKDTNDYGDPAYGFDDRRIDYSEIGPVGQGFYGYSFGFTVQQGFYELFNAAALPDGEYIGDDEGNLLIDLGFNYLKE